MQEYQAPGPIQEPFYSDMYTEKVLILKPDEEIAGDSCNALMHSLAMNNAVGSIGGYYDEDLTILFMSSFFMNNLGYEKYEDFIQTTAGSLKNLIFRGDLQYFEGNRFREGSGAGLFHMMMKDGTPIYVRTFKTESTDKNGTPIWVMSVRVAWDAQNLELINGVIQSGVWYIDFNEDSTVRKVTWSQRFRQMLGFTGPEDFPDTIEAWSSRIHPAFREKVMEKFFMAAADITDMTKYSVEYRAMSKDGVYHWFRESAEVNRRTNGTPSRMTGIFVNIDEEHRVREANEKYSALHRAYSKSNICEYYVDLNDNSFECMKMSERLGAEISAISGWDELCSVFVNEHVHEENRESLRLLLDRGYIRQELQKLNSELSTECRACYNDEEYWIRAMVLPGDCNENGVPQHAIVFLRDITNAKRAEEDLHRMAKDNHDMDELLSGMVRLVKRFAVCDFVTGTYTLHNLDGNELIRSSGTYDEMIAQFDSSFKMLDDDQSLSYMLSEEHFRKRLHSRSDIYNFEYCSKDEKLFKNMSAIPLEFRDGELSRVLLIIQDVTQAKRSERQAREALKDAYLAANRANQAKTVFMSNMSHDIRTPMNAIIGMTAIAGAHINEKERVLDCLGKITQSSRHLLSLINEVLDMGQIERGNISFVEEEFRLPDLVDDLVTIVKPDIEQHAHDFSVVISDIHNEEVIGDRLRIQQVFVNIVSNAVKYTPDGGKIRLTISEKPTRTSTACYDFIIEDNGIGMTEEFQKVIFEPFTRADTERTTKIPGTGLGMAITKNIVSMMNGDIKVESAPGKGSRFTVTIFLKLQADSCVSTDELADLPVLVANDDRACCESTVQILDEIGMNGEWVLSGRDAVDLTVERHESGSDFFAVILDWKMPDMDGIQTAREIRRRVGNNVPIIVFTAYDCSEVEKEAREAGVDAFITKPLFRSRLTALFKELVSGRNRNTAEQGGYDELGGVDFTGKRVLLVEDNEINREIAREIIGATGAQTVCAENGRVAVDLIKENGPDSYDIVFMDIQMPVMNGYEAARAIRALPGCDGLPIVAMTANAFAEDVILAKNAGMNEHISKPIDLKRLGEILRKWL